MTITQLTNPVRLENQYRFDLINERKLRYGVDERVPCVIRAYEVVSKHDDNNYSLVLETSIIKVMTILAKDLK
jgi:hypothetical protein